MRRRVGGDSEKRGKNYSVGPLCTLGASSESESALRWPAIRQAVAASRYDHLFLHCIPCLHLYALQASKLGNCRENEKLEVIGYEPFGDRPGMLFTDTPNSVFFFSEDPLEFATERCSRAMRETVSELLSDNNKNNKR